MQAQLVTSVTAEMPSHMGCAGQELTGCSGAGDVDYAVVARGYGVACSKVKTGGVADGDN